jgi:diaminopimelate epimerase
MGPYSLNQEWSLELIEVRRETYRSLLIRQIPSGKFSLEFWKMHGIGNDFIVVDNRSNSIKELEISGVTKNLCRRRFSIGADGLILLQSSEKADVKMRIFNSDGSEAEMCGNGIRCLAKYCYENKIVRKAALDVETLSGIKTTGLTIKDEEVKEVKVNMGKPHFERAFIPMLGDGKCLNEVIKLRNLDLYVTCLSMGNPHCVTIVENVDSFPVSEIGPKVENHTSFPQRTNVGFVQILKRNEMKVRVWERGCGETLACGTGACASVVAGNLLQKVDNKATVHLLGGDLEIEYRDENVWMKGSAEKVFVGILG